MNKTITTIVIVLTLAVLAYFGFQAANSAPTNPPSGNIAGGIDVCLGKQCEGKKALLEAQAEAALWTPVPAPTVNPAKVEFEAGVYNTGSEVAPVLGWGVTGILLMAMATAVVALAIWFFFFELPRIKKIPVAGKSGTLLSLEFYDGIKLLGNVNTVGGTYLQQGTAAPTQLSVDPNVAIGADTNAAMREASISVGKLITRNQLFNNAADQMKRLLDTTLDGAANIRAAGAKPEGQAKKKDGDPPIITIK